MNNVSKNAKLKIKRANNHIDSLIRESSPLSRDLYEVVNGPGRSIAVLANPDCFYLTFQPKQPIAEHFGAIIGDVVNNLREALEYWINAALMAKTGATVKAYFPFSEKWEDLETSPNYPLVKRTFPDLAQFILENIKPCRNANLDLWAATSLCNQNKHNDFIPTVSVVNITNINIRAGGLVMNDCALGGDANRPLKLIRSAAPISIKQDFSTSISIVFPQGAVFENQPVIPTLTNMSEVVAQTINALDQFLVTHI